MQLSSPSPSPSNQYGRIFVCRIHADGSITYHRLHQSEIVQIMPANRNRHRAQRKSPLHPQRWLINIGQEPEQEDGDFIRLTTQYREHLKKMRSDESLGDKAKDFLIKHKRGDFNQIFRRWVSYIHNFPTPPDYDDSIPDKIKNVNSTGKAAANQQTAANATVAKTIVTVQHPFPPLCGWNLTDLRTEHKKHVIQICTQFAEVWLCEAYNPVHRDYGNPYWEPIIEREWTEKYCKLSLLVTTAVLKDVVVKHEFLAQLMFKRGPHIMLPLLQKLHEMRLCNQNPKETWDNLDKFKKYVNATISLSLLLKGEPRYLKDFKIFLNDKVFRRAS